MIKRKKALIIISVTVVICILICTLTCAIVGGFMIYDFAQKNPLRMPTWYVCKQIEKEIPIGSDADTVIEIMKSKDDWSTEEEFIGDEYKYYEIYSLPKGFNNNISSQADYYSFSKINYKKESRDFYALSTCIGAVPERGTDKLFGYYVHVMFILDENKELIDILIFRIYVPIE